MGSALTTAFVGSSAIRHRDAVGVATRLKSARPPVRGTLSPNASIVRDRGGGRAHGPTLGARQTMLEEASRPWRAA
jgi:hypothetical protein